MKNSLPLLDRVFARDRALARTLDRELARDRARALPFRELADLRVIAIEEASKITPAGNGSPQGQIAAAKGVQS